jgi:ABC-2 type transport system permease protein
VKRYLRSRAKIVASLGQPLLYVVVLGLGLRPTFQRAGEGDYLEFMAPGIVGMTILFAAFISGTKVLWDRQVGFLKETLVAPAPRLHIMLGRIFGDATTATMQGSIVLAVLMLAGFRPGALVAIPLALLFMALIAVVFSALGTLVGTRLEEMDTFQLFMSFLLMPLFFLSGALFPLSNLPTALAIVTRFIPSLTASTVYAEP